MYISSARHRLASFATPQNVESHFTKKFSGDSWNSYKFGNMKDNFLLIDTRICIF